MPPMSAHVSLLGNPTTAVSFLGSSPFASVGKVSHTFVGVGAAFVAPYPGLFCVASDPYGVVCRVFRWHNVALVHSLPSVPVVEVDNLKWCVSGSSQFKRLVSAVAIEIASLA